MISYVILDENNSVVSVGRASQPPEGAVIVDLQPEYVPSLLGGRIVNDTLLLPVDCATISIDGSNVTITKASELSSCDVLVLDVFYDEDILRTNLTDDSLSLNFEDSGQYQVLCTSSEVGFKNVYRELRL
jgi:hypothetical protein